MVPSGGSPRPKSSDTGESHWASRDGSVGVRGRPLSPEHRAKISASLTGKSPSPETREKLRAWQIGKPKPRHIVEKLRATMNAPEMRAVLSELRRQESNTPARKAQLHAIQQARRGKPMSSEGIARWQASMERRMQHHGLYHSALEERAAVLLLPLGYKRFVWLGQNSYDFGLADKSLVIEVNGCYWHDHRFVNPACSIEPRPGVRKRDLEKRALCVERGVTLIELWECEEAYWPEMIGLPRAA